jgi:hypothetical protein
MRKRRPFLPTLQESWFSLLEKLVKNQKLTNFQLDWQLFWISHIEHIRFD